MIDLKEHEAKELLATFGIRVPHGALFEGLETAKLHALQYKDFVVKAQVRAGARGKSGGVLFANSVELAVDLASKLLGSTLVTAQTSDSGEIVTSVLIEERVKILHEYYVGLSLDRYEAVVVLTVSQSGGVNVEDCPVRRVALRESLSDAELAIALDFLDLAGRARDSMRQFIVKLYAAFTRSRALQIEVNPCALLPDRSVCALDAKISLDSNGDDLAQNRYVEMDGNIGCIVNGAGLAMATLDVIKSLGGNAANFLDLGGGASARAMQEALNRVVSHPRVSVILVNIFGGITRCDDVARLLIEAAQGMSVPMIVRLVGTNAELASQLIAGAAHLNILAETDLKKAVTMAVEAVR